MIDIKILNSEDELQSFPVSQSIRLEISETISEDALKEYVSLYRLVEDKNHINLSPPYAYNIGYIKENYGDEDVSFEINDKLVTIKPNKALKVSSKYILYIGYNLYSSNTKVNKLVNKSTKATLLVEAIEDKVVTETFTLKVLTNSKITETSNSFVVKVRGVDKTVNLKSQLIYNWFGLSFKFVDTLYLKDDEYEIVIDSSTKIEKEFSYLINTVPLDSIDALDSILPSSSLDTKSILEFYKKAEVLKVENKTTIPQYIHINTFTIPKPEGYTLNKSVDILYTIKEAFRDYTLTNLGLYDKETKYEIVLIEEGNLFIVEVFEAEKGENNTFIDEEENVLLSKEKRVL